MQRAVCKQQSVIYSERSVVENSVLFQGLVVSNPIHQASAILTYRNYVRV